MRKGVITSWRGELRLYSHFLIGLRMKSKEKEMTKGLEANE